MLKARLTRTSVLSGCVFIISLLQYACTPGSCLEETESAVKAAFYQTGTGSIVAPATVTVYGLGMESVALYLDAPGRTDILLPLNPATSSSRFIIIANGISDTITIVYSSFPHLISKECGYSMYNTLELCTSTNNLIDTVFVQNPDVTTKYNENIRIFY